MNIMYEILLSIMDNPANELRQQWVNPGDILSLLLLIGGDVIRKAIAQLVGPAIKIPRLWQSQGPIRPSGILIWLGGICDLEPLVRSGR